MQGHGRPALILLHGVLTVNTVGGLHAAKSMGLPKAKYDFLPICNENSEDNYGHP